MKVRALHWLLPLAVVLLAALIVAAPLAMAVAVVLICAGPHNWCEARYFLSRMPARWGRLRPAFLVGLSGVVSLTAGFVGLSLVPSAFPSLSDEGHLSLLAAWQTMVIAWVVTLCLLRVRLDRQSRQRVELKLDAYVHQGERTRVVRIVAVAALACTAAWLWPLWSSVALVFAHPLLALVFLDRELSLRRVAWQPAWRTTMALLPAVLVAVWWGTTGVDAAPLVATPKAAQVGAFLLPDAAAPALLATHVLLESLHYGVWIVGIPLTTAALPWHLRGVPLVAASRAWRRWLAAGLAVGGAMVVGLWILFAIDYAWTRQAYFTIAVAHVLAEVPFLVLFRR
ncbi:MAG TPA: hypothetical protein VMF13_10590 [Luteitalea sp.]|nr:hypothetical protein [Luteitalea sp.]